ncbi:hypothetical protein PBI_BIGMAMA_82 [Mycobacterium phage BigMama]|uniref:Uncharacterized protein n=1 Tax=Mycobacterium phage BigMama TaxID=2126786 RepID=A0A2P1N5A4_9CAUD|nr:hypothetical protein PBI_BIGMAMA_82 [Mycobacterium phage BigMama]
MDYRHTRKRRECVEGHIERGFCEGSVAEKSTSRLVLSLLQSSSSPAEDAGPLGFCEYSCFYCWIAHCPSNGLVL